MEMGLFDRAKSIFGFKGTVNSTLIDKSLYGSPGSGLYPILQAPGFKQFFNYADPAAIELAYRCCPPFRSIINRQASAVANGKLWLLNLNNDGEAEGPYATKMRKLLANPNPLQSYTDFEIHLNMTVRKYGWCVILPIIPVGFDITSVSKLWIISPEYITLEHHRQPFFTTETRVKSIRITCGGQISDPIPAEKLIFIHDKQGSSDDSLLPTSMVETLKEPINNILGILESMGVLINNRGALGILSKEPDKDGDVPLTKAQKDALQLEFLSYGTKKNQARVIMSSLPMNYQQIGMPYKDLMFSEWLADSTMQIADVTQYPYQLLAHEKSGSYNDVNEFKKEHYQDFVIPFANSIMDQLSKALKLYENGCRLNKDFAHVHVLQEDKQKKATARKSMNEALQIEFFNNLITLNRWLELNEENPKEGKEGNMYYHELIKLGWTFGQITKAPEKNENA